MKHFELKFGEVKEMLTKDQMTQISGGCGLTINPSCGGGVEILQCDGNADYCQGYADGKCAGDDCCDDSNC